MFRSSSIWTTCSIALAVLGCVAVTGCNTEGMWVKQEHPEGAVTNSSMTEGAAVQDINIIDANEVDIVEEVMTHRASYHQSLVALRDYYIEHGSNDKRKWAEAELADLSRVRPFKYILSAEIPNSSLRPERSVAEADAMYQNGVELMRKGGHGVPALYRQDLMREALRVFHDLITKYPNSDKIDDAAFCCGEIYKEYFKDQELIAVKWYERAHQWDPDTPHPALFQAAVVYDFRLHDRARALELYHDVLEKEQENKSNLAFATRRIYELTEGMQQLESPRPASEATLASPHADARGVDDMFGSERNSDDVAMGNETEATPQTLVPVVDLGPDDE